MNLLSMTRDFEPIEVPSQKLALDILHALFRPESPLLDDLISRFLYLPRDEGGYGWVAVDAVDIAVIRHAVVAQGTVLLRQHDGHDLV